jgi:hypothetical protein
MEMPMQKGWPWMVIHGFANSIRSFLAQTASKFPLRWWIIHSTLSRRDQLDEPSGPYSGRMRRSMCKRQRLQCCGVTMSRYGRLHEPNT